jgi:hypothetical protein
MVRERSGTTIQTALSMLGGMHLRKASMERVFDNVMGKKETGVVPITPPPAAAPVTPSPEKPPPEEGRIKKMMRLKYEVRKLGDGCGKGEFKCVIVNFCETEL